MEHEMGVSDTTPGSVNHILSSEYLRESNLLNLIPEAMYVCDMYGIIQRYNEQAVYLWGRRPVLGDKDERFCGAFKLYLPDGTYLPHDQTPVAACLKDGLPRKDMEVIIERPDLSRVHVLVNIMPIRDDAGNQIGMINCFYDVTEKKKTEKKIQQVIADSESRYQNSEAKYRKLINVFEIEVEKKILALKRKSEDLKISEERYHKMVEEVEDYAILRLDKNGIIQNWNKGAEKIKGYKEEEIVGKNFEEFYLPEDRANELPLHLLNHARETGKAIHEGWRKRKDGTAFWGSLVLTALHDDDNNVIGFSKVTRDLTERKLAEDKLNEYLSQLEFQNKELEQFVYAASHDLKEPLRKIHFYSDYIERDDENQLSPKSIDYLSRSMNAVERMKRLIEDLLTYSRSTSNIESHKTVNLNEVFDEVVVLHKEELEPQNGKIEIDKLPVIMAVPFQIKQLFFNLINNAVKYKHPDRELQINIKYELVKAGEIQEYKVEPDIQYHKISVIDNGVGFDRRYANKIFEIFQRLNNASDASGSGIGLAICKKIVQNHKGFIQATGKPDVGANFSIYLPVSA